MEFIPTVQPPQQQPANGGGHIVPSHLSLLVCVHCGSVMGQQTGSNMCQVCSVNQGISSVCPKPGCNQVAKLGRFCHSHGLHKKCIEPGCLKQALGERCKVFVFHLNCLIFFFLCVHFMLCRRMGVVDGANILTVTCVYRVAAFPIVVLMEEVSSNTVAFWNCLFGYNSCVNYRQDLFL